MRAPSTLPEHVTANWKIYREIAGEQKHYVWGPAKATQHYQRVSTDLEFVRAILQRSHGTWGEHQSYMRIVMPQFRSGVSPPFAFCPEEIKLPRKGKLQAHSVEYAHPLEFEHRRGSTHIISRDLIGEALKDLPTEDVKTFMRALGGSVEGLRSISYSVVHSHQPDEQRGIYVKQTAREVEVPKSSRAVGFSLKLNGHPVPPKDLPAVISALHEVVQHGFKTIPTAVEEELEYPGERPRPEEEE